MHLPHCGQRLHSFTPIPHTKYDAKERPRDPPITIRSQTSVRVRPMPSPNINKLNVEFVVRLNAFHTGRGAGI